MLASIKGTQLRDASCVLFFYDTQAQTTFLPFSEMQNILLQTAGT